MSDVDPETFRSRWESHIKDLNRLRLAVPVDDEYEDRVERIDEARDELLEVLDEVVSEREEGDR